MEESVKIASILKSAIWVTLEFHGRQYKGEVTALTAKEHVMFKASGTDKELVRIPINRDAMYLRVLMAQGGFNVYQTRLMEKKIPLLQLEFPEEECRSLVREYHRYPVDMDTPLILLNRKEGDIVGLGTIYNISECGVYLSTALRLKIGDRVGFCLGFRNSGYENPLELTGEVKRLITTTPEGGVSYGVRFTGVNIRVLRQVQAFIKHR